MNQEEGKNEILVVSIKVPFICCGQILFSNVLYFMSKHVVITCRHARL